MNLYEIVEEVAELLTDTDDEGELAHGVEQQLDRLQMQFDAKVEALCGVVRNCEAEEKALKEEASRFSKRAQTAERCKDRVKAYMKSALEQLGVDKMTAGRFKVAIQLNSVPSTTFAGDPKTLPAEFQRVTVEADRTALVDAWKDGKLLPDGVKVEKGTHLRIR